MWEGKGTAPRTDFVSFFVNSLGFVFPEPVSSWYPSIDTTAEIWNTCTGAYSSTGEDNTVWTFLGQVLSASASEIAIESLINIFGILAINFSIFFTCSKQIKCKETN